MGSILRERLKHRLETLMGHDTQEAFAARLGIGQGSVNRILKCQQNVGIDMLEKIMTMTGSSIETLIGTVISNHEGEGLHGLNDPAKPEKDDSFG